MRDFTILTDSCCDFTSQMVQELELSVLPLSFIMDGKEYFNYPDNRDIAPDDFYARLRGGSLGTTSAISVGVFHEAMEQLAAAGRDILCISFSSGLSTTYQSACIAAQEVLSDHPDSKILVVDSRAASMGQGLLVYLAARKRQDGASIEEVRDWTETRKLSICHQFTVDDLHFLKRGGRISGATALMGTMLNIKPVLHVDDTGRLVNIGKARGRQAALKALMDKMEQTAIDPHSQTVFISHGDCPEDAQTLAQMVRERFGVREIVINYIGPVIGAHSGPGTLALFYIGTER